MTINEAMELCIGSLVWKDKVKWKVNDNLEMYFALSNDDSIWVPVIDSDGFTENFRIEELELEYWEKRGS